MVGCEGIQEQEQEEPQAEVPTCDETACKEVVLPPIEDERRSRWRKMAFNWRPAAGHNKPLHSIWYRIKLLRKLIRSLRPL
mmetsp:Transcript_72875/g.122745  ORF Transcript_72875/g.122745 Transcript_72875/m.122745 type:complete len:81 (+) Transcript_72875:559-801(+)